MSLLRFLVILIVISPVSIILYFWWSTSGASFSGTLGDSISAIGRLCGLLLVYLVLLQVLLRSRVFLLEKTFGFGTLNRIHKKNGYVVFSLLLLHPLLLSIGYSKLTGNALLHQIYLFIFTYPDVLKAFLALLIFVAVVVTSVYMVRKKLPYELWYLIHLATYIAILFAFDHQLKLGSDFAGNQAFVIFWYILYGIVFVSLLFFRVFAILYRYIRYRFVVSKVVKEASDTYSIYVTGKNIQQFAFLPGQFAFLRFLTKNIWFESHPFSFSKVGDRNKLRFTIKNSGNFTANVKDIKEGTSVFLDGPHGEFTLNKASSKKLLFIAGGVGITPIMSLIEESSVKGYDCILFYANKLDTDIIFQKELEALSKENNFPIFYVISQNPKYKGLQGRITADVVKANVKDLKSRDVYICGPQQMIVALSNELLPLVSPKKIHKEVFEL